MTINGDEMVKMFGGFCQTQGVRVTRYHGTYFRSIIVTASAIQVQVEYI